MYNATSFKSLVAALLLLIRFDKTTMCHSAKKLFSKLATPFI